MPTRVLLNSAIHKFRQGYLHTLGSQQYQAQHVFDTSVLPCYHVSSEMINDISGSMLSVENSLTISKRLQRRADCGHEETTCFIC